MEAEAKNTLTSSTSSDSAVSPLSMISSTSSDGVVLDSQEALSANENIDFDSDSSDSSIDSDDGCEEIHSVDGLVLMGSTRLRPAPETSMDSASKLILYTQTFRKLFGKTDCTGSILPLALHGNLHDNPFRSMCWRVFLNVVSSNSQQWTTNLKTVRENYKFLMDKFHTAQRLQDSSIDLTINNPLSQAEDSPWNQHFQDAELRKLVQQDVVRVFPDLEFFQSNSIKEKLLNILFLYARTHQDIGYRQGMHELAAPLLYVIQSDCDTYSTLRASLSRNQRAVEDLDKTVSPELFDRTFIEADAYSLFEALMEGQLSDWYRTSQSRHELGSRMDDGKPWCRPQDQTSGNMLVTTLNNIHDVLLKRHDPALYLRLEKLEIFPQLYGIRWLRLLFGREFQFRETLMLWDAIFADSCPPSLCDQLVVSLLMALRDLLLRYEYQDAVQLLMKLPSNLSVTYCTQFALHLKDPIRFPKPTGSAFLCGYTETAKKNRKGETNQAKKSTPRTEKSRRASNNSREKKSPSESNEMNKANSYSQYSIHEDTNSDFTVLDLHKNEEDFQDIISDKGSVKTTGDKIHYRKPQYDKSGSSSVSSSGDASPQADLVRNTSVKMNLETAVSKLDKLLQYEENLTKRSEIFHCIGAIHSLVSEIKTSENSINGTKCEMRDLKTERKGKLRTASVAVDVTSYFKVEMDQ